MGIHSWQPAQGLNDIARIQAKYGNDLIINGTWSTNGPAWSPGASEELVRSELRKCMDSFAVGGGMIFWSGGQVGNSADQIQRINWVNDEARRYGKTFYSARK